MSLSANKKNWLIAIGYIFFIYLTLGMVPAPVRFLRAHGLLRLCLAVLYFSSLTATLIYLMKKTNRENWRIFSLILIFLAYLLFARKVITLPEEQIHFFEYGLVGVFFARALEASIPNRTRIFFAALALAGLAGTVDELIQGLLPNRHYDPRDIALNVVSAGLGLLLFSILRVTKPQLINPREQGVS